MNNFRKLIVWQKSIELVKLIYTLSKSLPVEEKYNLKSQMVRCAVSIPSNIAEGCSRSGKKDFKRFLEIALGSTFELETQLIITESLYFDNNKLKNIFNKNNEIQKILNTLITKFKKEIDG